MRDILPDNVYQLAFYQSFWGKKSEEKEIENFLGKLPNRVYEKVGFKLGEAANQKYTIETRPRGDISKGAFYYTNSLSKAATVMGGLGGTTFLGYTNEAGKQKKKLQMVNINPTSVAASQSKIPLKTVTPEGTEIYLFKNKETEDEFTFNYKEKEATVRGFDKTLIFGKPKPKILKIQSKEEKIKEFKEQPTFKIITPQTEIEKPKEKNITLEELEKIDIGENIDVEAEAAKQNPFLIVGGLTKEQKEKK